MTNPPVNSATDTKSHQKPSAPKVGIGVLIRREGKILLGLRKSKHGKGTWCPPGGHLEHGESFENCALREVAEECGVQVTTPKLAIVTNDFFEESQKHYVTLQMVADWVSGEAQRLEPDKCSQWEWFAMDNLPSPLFLPIAQSFDKGFNPLKTEDNIQR